MLRRLAPDGRSSLTPDALPACAAIISWGFLLQRDTGLLNLTAGPQRQFVAGLTAGAVK